ncbi:MAG: DegQ family serine endoprotease [Alphaproteobacteria bacterium]|nr:DegQ family serine endoprotease [Alphaproteobacteria bacterium]
MLILFRMRRTSLFLCFFLLCSTVSSNGWAEVFVPQSREQIRLSFAPLVKKVTPAVVNIYTQKKVQQRVSPFFNDPFFSQFFGGALAPGLTRERMEHALGSGVIVREDGLVVTSRHVIAGADEIRVVLSDRREFDAEVVLTDDKADLAVLRLESTKGGNFPFLDLRDSDDAEIGDLVLAIGNPFGVGQTVTSGIISAVAHKAVGAGDLGYFIQTDAAINPGNSGGALVTMDGKLIGINAAIFSRDGGNMGIGFAVPSNMVRVLMGAAKQGKSRMMHPWMGLDGQEVSQDIAVSLGLNRPMGFLVKSAHPSSPAAKAGIKAGDVIVSVGGKTIEDPEAFRYRIAALSIGAKAELEVVSRGKTRTVTLDLIAPPEDPSRRETVVKGRNPASGATLANVSPAVVEELGLPSDPREGVVVTEVKPGSVAARIGLVPGDIVAAVNGQEIVNVREAINAFAAKPSHWKLTIRRGNHEITMMLGG